MLLARCCRAVPFILTKYHYNTARLVDSLSGDNYFDTNFVVVFVAQNKTKNDEYLGKCWKENIESRNLNSQVNCYGEVKIFCCLFGFSGFCVQGGDPTGTGMGKLTSKKKITTESKHYFSNITLQNQ